MALFSKKGIENAGETPLYVGRVSGVNVNVSTISPYSGSTTVNLLQRLRSAGCDMDKIQLLIKEHPDTSMAYTVLMSLVNQGGDIEFIVNGGKNQRLAKRIKDEWRLFASRVNATSGQGLDGLVYQLHGSDFAMGGMACEVVVKPDLSDIEDVYPISPQTLVWELEKRENGMVWVPYQMVNSSKIDLSRANFLWFPFAADIDMPNGNLLFKPVIMAADMQLEFFRSSQTVLYRIGTPRYKFTVNVQKMVEGATPDIKNNAIKLKEFVNGRINEIVGSLRGIGVENDFVLTDDTEATTIGGDNPAFFQGVGAYADIIDIQVMNALKVLGSLMNRHNNGGSYALSTVEFKVIADMLVPRQNAEKRLVESIARIWLRVHGYDADVKYTPNPIEWQTFKDKMEYLLKRQEYHRRGEEYGWISPDEAASKSMGAEKAYNPTEMLFEYVKNASQNEKTEDGANGE